MLKNGLRLIVLLVFTLAVSFTASAQSNGTYGGLQKDYSGSGRGSSGEVKLKFRRTKNKARQKNSNTEVKRRNQYKYKMIRKERQKPFYGRDDAGRRGNSFYYKR